MYSLQILQVEIIIIITALILNRLINYNINEVSKNVHLMLCIVDGNYMSC